MMGVSRVAGTLLCHHLAGDPGAKCRSARISAHERCRVCMCVIFQQMFRGILGKHSKNVGNGRVSVLSAQKRAFGPVGTGEHELSPCSPGQRYVRRQIKVYASANLLSI